MGPNMEPKILQKSALGRPGPPRDANGRPEGSMEQFWSLWPFSTHLDAILDPFGGHFCVGPCLNLRSSFGHPELMFQAVQATGALFCRFALWTSGAFFLGDLNHHTSKPQRLQERGPAAWGRSP